MLSVGRLRVLREVAYRGSLSGAAAALSYTQSAVSQQIAALEAETGMTLLERHPRGVSLTAAGQTLVAHADSILAQLEAAEAAAELARMGITARQVRHGYDLATWDVLRAAVADGQDIRIGLEDTTVLPDGSPASGNADLVAAAARLAAET